MICDLHTHTTASDGKLTPFELIERALQSNVDVLSITDHDSISAYKELSGTSYKWHSLNKRHRIFKLLARSKHSYYRFKYQSKR